MFLKSKKLPFMIFSTCLLIGTSIFAAPALKEIKTYLNPSIQYTLDGETILIGTQTISYQNKNYVSVAELANALGLEVTYENNTVSFSTRKNDAVTIPSAVVKEVLPESNNVIILPTGAEDTVSNYVVLHIEPQTIIKTTNTNQSCTLEDLQEGMILSVTHNSVMTRSLPPQTVAYTLTILEETTTPILEDESANDCLLSNMNIISVNADENFFIVVPEGKDATDFYDQIIIRYSKDTLITTHSGQELAATFKEGQVVTIKVGPAATLSIPPQMLALEITLEA